MRPFSPLYDINKREYLQYFLYINKYIINWNLINKLLLLHLKYINALYVKVTVYKIMRNKIVEIFKILRMIKLL